MFSNKTATWDNAKKTCCSIGLTLATVESVTKHSCLVSLTKSASTDIFLIKLLIFWSILAFKNLKGREFWTSGTDQDCPGKFKWCSNDKDFVPAEINWKKGHPQSGCTYLELQSTSNATVLATADSTQQKLFLCEVNYKN